MSGHSRFRLGLWVLLFAVVLMFGAAPVLADPPARVARLSHIRGSVSFLPAGENDWGDAILNRPLVTGDQLYTYRDARVEMDIGAATVRLDDLSSFSLFNLDDNIVQIELTQGTLNLQVHKLYSGQTYEIDTPGLAFVVSQPGEYRIDIGSRDEATRVTVFAGSGMVYGDGNASMRVDGGQSYRFIDPLLRGDTIRDMPQTDDFDRWCGARADRYRNSVSRRYVSDEVIGYSDLDEYGSWGHAPGYGTIWYPNRVSVGWAPYRHGHWSWIEPWGWSWIDDAPWGFAPFHYGRWAHVRNRWGWIPGPMTRRPVYAPALVLFIGGHNWGIGISDGGGPIGWAPLGPRDLYMPPYRVSRGYFSNVNGSNIRNTTIINNTNIINVYNNYAAGRATGKGNDTYRHNPDAVTAVSRDTFVHARPVEVGRLHLNREHLQRAKTVNKVDVSPTRASLMSEKARNRRVAAPPNATAKPRVIEHTAPPPRPKSFMERVKAREQGNGRPQADDAAVKAPRRRQDGHEPAGRVPVPRAERKSDKREAPRDKRAPETSEARPERVIPTPVAEPSFDKGRDREQRQPSRVKRAPGRQVEPAAKVERREPVQVEAQPERVRPAPGPEPTVDKGRASGQRRPSRVQRAPERQVEPAVQVERRKLAPPSAVVESQPPTRLDRRYVAPDGRPGKGGVSRPDNAAAPSDNRRKQDKRNKLEKDCAGKDANDKECTDRNSSVR